jgi:hypothetical protein
VGDGWFAFGIYQEMEKDMTSGPIDFGDQPVHETGYATEMGGVDGLIQPELVAGKEAHVDLTEQEKRDIAARRGMHALSTREGWTGIPDDERIIDPMTGRELDKSELTDVTDAASHKGELSTLKPQPKDV